MSSISMAGVVIHQAPRSIWAEEARWSGINCGKRSGIEGGGGD